MEELVMRQSGKDSIKETSLRLELVYRQAATLSNLTFHTTIPVLVIVQFSMNKVLKMLD